MIYTLGPRPLNVLRLQFVEMISLLITRVLVDPKPQNRLNCCSLAVTNSLRQSIISFLGFFLSFLQQNDLSGVITLFQVTHVPRGCN